MSVRLDFEHGLKPDAHKWLYEAKDKVYKLQPPKWPFLVEEIPEKEIVGGFYKSTSAIGADVLIVREDEQQAAVDSPKDGYPVFGRIKTASLKVSAPREVQRDLKHRVANWIKDYVAVHWATAIENTKEMLITEFIEKGGYTAGDDIYNQNNAVINLTTYTSPKLQYDGKPVFNLLGNERTAINAATYYNGLTYGSGALAEVTGVTSVLTGAMKNLLITNGKRENGTPFDNIRDLVIVCHQTQEDNWNNINTADKNPDNFSNTPNPYKGIFRRVIGLPRLTNSDLSVMMSAGKGIVAKFFEPKINFWEENDPKKFWASVDLDYVLTMKNFRPLVAVNAATS